MKRIVTVIGLGLALLAPPAQAEEGWVLTRERGAVDLRFGGKDKEQGGLGYVSHGFVCKPGARAGLQLVEGMPARLKGKVTLRLETAATAFDIRGEMQPNEEAGTPGFEADLTAQQLAAVLNSPGQVFLVAGKDRIRVGLRGIEPHREAFLAACRPR